VQNVGPGVWSDYAISAEICSWARAVLPNTGAEAEFVRDGLGVPPEKIHVVPNGVDERFADGDPELFRRETGLEKCILTVGHIGPPRKNVFRLLRALAEVDRAAVFIGRIAGPEAESCVQEAQRNPHVRLLGALDHEAPLLASAYAACDVFVLPSMFETPGIAALEAGLAGAQIVITPYGGTREYFGDLAVYVEPRSERAIREGILQAISRPHSTALGDHIRREFLWERVAEKTAAVYRIALRGH
jgi:glycosyltransferase involved in cell wall biosynthesis